MADTADNGVYVDTKTGKVVKSQPEEGKQLVPPGGTVTKDRQRIIDVYENATSSEAREAELAAARGDGVETATVDTKTTSKKSSS